MVLNMNSHARNRYPLGHNDSTAEGFNMNSQGKHVAHELTDPERVQYE